MVGPRVGNPGIDLSVAGVDHRTRGLSHSGHRTHCLVSGDITVGRQGFVLPRI